LSVTLDPAGPFTTDDPIQLLTATPIGGMWSGDANKIGNFDPSRGVGTYTVTYTYTDEETGCVAEGSMEIIVEPGLEPFEDVNGFIIYPVPTDGDLNINLENYMNELVQVRIVDASSRVVFEQVFNENHLQVETIDLSYLSSGIYHLLFDSMGYRSDVTFTVNK
ncbi:T9SS type A sorting domain-containing protein, partial [Croceitalea sp. P059]|uniref:T9SS type A sorting domain-containing protein n=1 Tax=Croceitalea sp. P059 TaxID=3075601 RepID=UPI002887D69D